MLKIISMYFKVGSKIGIFVLVAVVGSYAFFDEEFIISLGDFFAILRFF